MAARKQLKNVCTDNKEDIISERRPYFGNGQRRKEKMQLEKQYMHTFWKKDMIQAAW